MLAVTLWYLGWARHDFKGPIRTVDYPEEEQMAPEPGVAPSDPRHLAAR